MKQINSKEIYKKVFVDTANSRPRINMPIKKAGINNRPHYIEALDPFDGKTKTRLKANLEILVNVAATQKGLHVSRMENCLHELNQNKTIVFQKYAKLLAQKIRSGQTNKTTSAYVSIEADYEKYSSKNISGKPSHELLKLYLECQLEGKNITEGIGLEAPIINACPCAQKWGMRDFYQFLESQNFTRKQINALMEKAPKQSHTNRGKIKLFIYSPKADFKDLEKIIDNSSPIIRELLNSQDEHLIIKDAHSRGMFCEDLIREAVFHTYKLSKKKKLDPKTRVLITVEVDESIHVHNMYSVMDATIGEIGKYFKG